MKLYIHKTYMSYKVNLICIIILIVNHTQSYGNYLTYEYLFYYKFLSTYLLKTISTHKKRKKEKKEW